MCETSFGIWCWPSRAHGRRLDAGSLRGRDWTLQCTQSLYRAEVPCYDPGQLGRHSEKSGRNLWTRVLCWTSRKVNVFRQRHQPSNLRLFATDECKWLYSCLGARLYEERLFLERKQLTPVPEPIALAHALIVSWWPSWPSRVSQSIYME